jgi:hypothetical protein
MSACLRPLPAFRSAKAKGCPTEGMQDQGITTIGQQYISNNIVNSNNRFPLLWKIIPGQAGRLPPTRTSPTDRQRRPPSIPETPWKFIRRWRLQDLTCVGTWSQPVAYVSLQPEISGRHIAEVSRDHDDRWRTRATRSNAVLRRGITQLPGEHGTTPRKSGTSSTVELQSQGKTCVYKKKKEWWTNEQTAKWWITAVLTEQPNGLKRELFTHIGV